LGGNAAWAAAGSRGSGRGTGKDNLGAKETYKET
jgi:hypothetical protein